MIRFFSSLAILLLIVGVKTCGRAVVHGGGQIFTETATAVGKWGSHSAPDAAAAAGRWVDNEIAGAASSASDDVTKLGALGKGRFGSGADDLARVARNILESGGNDVPAVEESKFICVVPETRTASQGQHADLLRRNPDFDKCFDESDSYRTFLAEIVDGQGSLVVLVAHNENGSIQIGERLIRIEVLRKYAAKQGKTLFVITCKSADVVPSSLLTFGQMSAVATVMKKWIRNGEYSSLTSLRNAVQDHAKTLVAVETTVSLSLPVAAAAGGGYWLYEGLGNGSYQKN